MKRKNFIIFALCTLTAIAFAGCNKLNLDDPLLSGGNNAGINAGNNSSITTDDPAALIDAAYEKNLAATSCTITFSTGNTFEGDEKQEGGTEFDYDKFIITSDAISYETGEEWITLDKETHEKRVDKMAYVVGAEEYRTYEDYDDNNIVSLYIYETDVDAKEYIKNTAELPIDTYKDAFDALSALDLTASKEDDGNVIITAKNLEINDYSTVLSYLINVTPGAVSDRFKACTEFGAEVTINKDGFATSVLISAKDMPMFMTEDNDEFIDYYFKLEMTDINTTAIAKPDYVENFVLGTTDVTYMSKGWELEYRYNWNEDNEYAFYARAEDYEPTSFGQYEALTEIGGIKVSILGTSMDKQYATYESCTFNLIVPKDMPMDLNCSNKYSAVFCNNTKEEMMNLYIASPYGKYYDPVYDQEFLELTLADANIYYAGEWSYVDGVATPN